MSRGTDPELELKLELTPQEFQRVGAHPALESMTVGRPSTRTLHSIYFDTPDLRLHAHGISLRLRSADGGEWLQTVKTGNGSMNGLSKREEFASQVSKPEPNTQAIDVAGLRRRIQSTVRKSALEPLFETVVRRTTRQLHSDKGDIEFALDEGIVRAGNAEEKLCEAELELKAGSPLALLETATRLFASGSLRPAQISKAERGYNLVLGRQGESIAPHRAVYPKLKGDETCAQALMIFVQSACDQILANRRVALETDDPEGAHQLRIGLRRLRSALRAFRPLNDTPALRELEGHARDLARSVGLLRDADVLIESILPQVASRIKAEPGFSEMRQCLAAYRARRRGEIRAVLAGESWSRLYLYLLLWPSTIRENRSLQMPVSDLASMALQKSWRKVSKLGAGIDELSVDERHEMRKSLKTFRYTLEFFASLYAGNKLARFLKDLRNLQEIFGYINDVATAKRLSNIVQEHCPGDGSAQRAAGYVVGWHEADAEHAWAHAPREWRRLRRRARFWR